MSERLVASVENIDPSLVLDAYKRHPLANLETYKYFNQTGDRRSESRARFNEAAADGGTDIPPLYEYDDLDTEQLLKWRDDLTNLAEWAAICDSTVESTLLMRENITNRLHEVGLMLLVKAQSEMHPDDPGYDMISFQLGQNMREIYGVPEVTHWQGILGYRMKQLSVVEECSDVPDEVLEAWAYIKAELPEGLPIERPYMPREETIAWYRQQLEARIAPAQQAVADAIAKGEIVLDTDGKLDAQNIVKATRIALRVRGAQGWDAELTDEANIDTTQSREKIFIPRNRKMDVAEFDRVIQGHEIDIHVMTRINGDAGGEPVLGGTGCNGYLGWNEGNGKANEALLKGEASTEASAFSFYLSGGIALGLDGVRMRNQPDTHAIVWRMNFIDAYLQGKVSAANVGVVKMSKIENATKSLDRIFRGTNGRVPGVVFTKDVLTYYIGQVEVWRKWDLDMRLPEDIRISEHLLERSAKIDPLRKDHRRVASAGFRPWLVR